MPNTKIFYGSSYSATSYGGIAVEGKGDTALITFTDHDRNETKARVKVYTLNKLKKSKEFKSAEEGDSIDPLVHDWKTKAGKNCIIKYAGDDQLALVFTSDDVANDFKKIFAHFGFDGADYVNEVKFEIKLRDLTGLTSVQLKEVPGMNEQRIKLLLKHQSGMEKLLNKGVTIEQLAQADLSNLEKHLGSAYRLDDALKFITIQQVLGISHTPPAINEAGDDEDNGFRFAGGMGGGTWGEFSYEHDDHSITVTHDESKAKLELFFGVLKDKLVPSGEQLSKLTPNDMVHKWYTLGRESNDADQMVTIQYSPELQVVHKEAVDKDFPEDAFKTEMNGFYMHMLYTSPFYKEVDFGKFLEKKGTSFEALKAMPGMSQAKLALMLSNKYDIESLLDKGMTFEDFAKVDEQRFSYVVTHFNKAKSALEFVEPHELFGLGARPQRRFGLFDASASQAPVAAASANENTHRRQCVVM